MPKTKRTPTDVARKEARELIAKNQLPPYKDLAKKWGCSKQMVGYILKTVRAEKSTSKRTRSATAKAVGAKKVSKRHPLLHRLRTSLEKVENDLLGVEGYISAIPGLASSEINRLVKRAQTGVWSNFHGELTSVTDSVASLATVRRKKRVTRRKLAKG
jgi:DNA-binding transcriptional MocR family regulator